MIRALWLATALVATDVVATAALAQSPEAPVDAEALAPDRVVLLSSDEPDYRELGLPGEVSTDRVWPSRLVVLRGGTPVADRGIRNDLGFSGTGEREGTVEEARVAHDGAAAVVLTSRFRRREAPSEGEDPVEIASVLSWIDPEHPRGRWRLPLEPGHWVQELLLLPRARGLVVATSPRMDGEAVLQVLDPDGRKRFDVNELRASVLGMSPAAHGGFLAVDLAFVGSAPGRSRGILVLDLLRGSRWLYAWSYGDDFEPWSWELLDSGVLTVDTPGGERRYDRNGELLGIDGKR